MSGLAERLLAALLVGFLLVGGLWLYSRMDELGTRPSPDEFLRAENVDDLQRQVAAFDRTLAPAVQELDRAEGALAEAQAAYEFRREEYNTALAAGNATDEQRQRFEAARTAFEEARAARDNAASAVDAIQNSASGPRAELQRRQLAAMSRYESANRDYELRVAGIRLAYLLGVFALAFVLWRRAQARESRLEILALALLVFASIQMIVMAGDYAWHHFSAYAPFVISAVGVAGTVAGILLLRRFLLAPARLARVRLRKNECPFCGHTLTQAKEFCPECGRAVLRPCPHCGGRHLAYAAFCPVTGEQLD